MTKRLKAGRWTEAGRRPSINAERSDKGKQWKDGLLHFSRLLSTSLLSSSLVIPVGFTSLRTPLTVTRPSGRRSRVTVWGSGSPRSFGFRRFARSCRAFLTRFSRRSLVNRPRPSGLTSSLTVAGRPGLRRWTGRDAALRRKRPDGTGPIPSVLCSLIPFASQTPYGMNERPKGWVKNRRDEGRKEGSNQGSVCKVGTQDPENLDEELKPLVTVWSRFGLVSALHPVLSFITRGPKGWRWNEWETSEFIGI